MKTSKSTSKASGSARARRTHALGGCKTCRRRHIKCDQMRPSCLTCRASGIACEGFSTEVRWMSDKRTSMSSTNSARRHLYTEKSRESMSSALAAHVASSSIDASLTEIDARTRDPILSRGGCNIVIGPFSVLDLSGMAVPRPVDHDPQGQILPCEDEDDNTNLPGEALPTSPSTIDSLVNLDDFLHWTDLFDLESELLGTRTQPSLEVYDHDSALGSAMAEQECQVYDCSNTTLTMNYMHQRGKPDNIQTENEPESTTSTVDVLLDAPLLLRHFRDCVIPLMMPLPNSAKSPYRIMNLPAALLTLSDMTVLNEQNVKHARLANLYGVLACSAYHLSRNLPINSTQSEEYWQHISEQAHHQARDSLQRSLLTEVQGPQKAKYKDQLMAIFSLTAFAIISGRQKDARYYMVDAERLLRLRGLAKRENSRRARVLHHLYTWLRIVGESTYVLHDYKRYDALIESLNIRYSRNVPEGLKEISTSSMQAGYNARLDDFLRLDPPQSDNDLDIDDPKDRDVGLQDIHLEDSRNFNETMYMQIYNIPETWLSLLSQTTRMANVMDVIHSGSKAIHPDALDALQRRATRLENMICSLASRSIPGQATSTNAGSTDTLRGDPSAHMVRALTSALVIFFYRRIRQVNPWILQGHVDDVIEALHDFDNALEENQIHCPGAVWPAFIAGCEAIAPRRRIALLRWIEKGSLQSHFLAYSSAKEVMIEAWKRRDEESVDMTPSTRRNAHSVPSSWTVICREENRWLMLC